MSYRTLGFPEYGVTNASNCKWGFTPDSNPKRVKDINLFKKANAKKTSVIAYLIVFSEYGKANASISSVALPLSATTKMVKRGNKICIYLCKRTKVNITDMTYLRLLRVRTDQCKYRKLAFTPDRNPKRGNKKG